MARNGSGTYNLPAGNPVTTGTTISSTWANTTLSDMATALTGSIASDGQTTASGNLPMGGFIHTNVGNATVRNNYASAGQVQDGVITYLTSVSGTNTITAVGAVGMTAYATGQKFTFIAAGANTGAATININSIGAKSITKNGATALSAGDLASGAVAEVVYDGTQFQLISGLAGLSTPISASNGGTGLTSVGTSGNVLTSNGTSWVSSAPASGKVLQVVNATYSTSTSTTSNTYIDSGLTATITPTSATSKILVFVNCAGVQKQAVDAGTGVNLRLLRNSTTLVTFAILAAYTGDVIANNVASSSTTYLDNPATTSATTYKVQIASGATGNAYINAQSDTSTITLMEIAA